jgi:hypothetical protein
MARRSLWWILLGVALLALFVLLPLVACPHYCLPWKLHNQQMHDQARILVVKLDDRRLPMVCPCCHRSAAEPWFGWKSD